MENPISISEFFPKRRVSFFIGIYGNLQNFVGLSFFTKKKSNLKKVSHQIINDLTNTCDFNFHS